MTNTERSKIIKQIGLYAVVILTLVRFVVYPLQAAVTEKKHALADYYDSYKLKYRLLEQRKVENGGKSVVDKSVLSRSFYDKKIGFSLVQVDVVESIIKFAEKKSMNILGYELLEPIKGKNISEVPVMIRLEGKPMDILDILAMMEQAEKTLMVKSLEINRAGQDLRYFLTLSAFRLER